MQYLSINLLERGIHLVWWVWITCLKTQEPSINPLEHGTCRTCSTWAVCLVKERRLIKISAPGIQLVSRPCPACSVMPSHLIKILAPGIQLQLSIWIICFWMRGHLINRSANPGTCPKLLTTTTRWCARFVNVFPYLFCLRDASFDNMWNKNCRCFSVSELSHEQFQSTTPCVITPWHQVSQPISSVMKCGSFPSGFGTQ